MKRTLGLLALLTLAACGGGGSSGSTTPPTSAVRAYVDPPASGWRWTRNSQLSTSGYLVLELQGPGSAVSGRGVVFSLQADPGTVTWVPYPSSLVQNLAFNLGTGVPLMAQQQQAGLLTAGIFQKGQGNALALNGSLCRVALAPVAGLPKGRTLALSAPNLQLVPDTGT